MKTLLVSEDCKWVTWYIIRDCPGSLWWDQSVRWGGGMSATSDKQMLRADQLHVDDNLRREQVGLTEWWETVRFYASAGEPLHRPQAIWLKLCKLFRRNTPISSPPLSTCSISTKRGLFSYGNITGKKALHLAADHLLSPNIFSHINIGRVCFTL